MATNEAYQSRRAIDKSAGPSRQPRRRTAGGEGRICPRLSTPGLNPTSQRSVAYGTSSVVLVPRLAADRMMDERVFPGSSALPDRCPIIESAPRKVSPGRQFTGKKTAAGRGGFLPVNCRPGETFLVGRSYNGCLLYTSDAADE